MCVGDGQAEQSRGVYDLLHPLLGQWCRQLIPYRGRVVGAILIHVASAGALARGHADVRLLLVEVDRELPDRRQDALQFISF